VAPKKKNRSKIERFILPNLNLAGGHPKTAFDEGREWTISLRNQWDGDIFKVCDWENRTGDFLGEWD